ncbi:MAG: SusC/RagA family TonB-linked outer membrane protein [Bacteroidales bacterium]|nr:SusC/RagA family TonB-linked outer membrane protein [Bacteroidales bacterium]
MKLSTILMMVFTLSLSATGLGQFSFNAEGIKVRDVFQIIENESSYRFFYNDDFEFVDKVVNLKVEDQNINQVLDKLLKLNDFSYQIFDNKLIVVSLKEDPQQSIVKGKVTDTKGNPLPGTTVQVKGTIQGIITDLNGNFSIDVANPNAILIFSFVGYIPKEIPVQNQTSISVILSEDIRGLEEVVVIGYGTQKKVDLTGSVESINGNQIARQPVAQTSQALVGLTPGLTAIQSSGQPGKDNSTLRIRGTGSIGASNDPLILIDGVEGDLNSINPNDIEDISILKDAAAASIYGSRASNGVILVTTKRAKSGKLSLNYSNFIGWQKPTELPKFLGALDFLKYSGESQSVIDNYAAGMVSNPDLYPDTDWVNEVFTESGFQQYHNMSVSGGNETIKSLASISFLNQGANIINYNYKRYNGRFNSDIKISNKIDINFDLGFDRSLTKAPVTSLTYVVRDTYRIPPIYSAIHSDGSWGDGWGGENPVAAVRDGGNSNSQSNYFRGILRANYTPVKDLKFSVMYSPEYNDGYNSSFTKMYQTIIDWEAKTKRNYPNRNGLSQSNSRSFTNNFNALATYNKVFGRHIFSVLLGYEFIKYDYSTFGASRQDFILDKYEVLNAGSAESDGNSGSATQSGLVSYFGRLNYSFNNKYLFEANLRRDASSRFASENRVSIFPSFSAGWRLSEESFIKNLDLFSNLKLRASWGQLGNQQIGSDFPYASSISMGTSNFLFNNAIITGATQDVLANSAIKWETTETTNFGLDLGFLNQKLTLTAEYYIRKTNDILLRLPIPLVIGLSPSMQNAGNVENKGFDLSLGWKDDIGDFTYNARLNFSDVRNNVTNLSGVGPIISGNSITQVGSPIGSIYAYESVGIFQDAATITSSPTQFGSLIPGNIQYKDQLTVDTDNDHIPDAADGKINSDDRVIVGDPFPRMSFGLDLSAAYKGFDLSVYVQGVGKRDVILQGDAVWALFNAGKIQEWHVRECWSQENTGAKYPIIKATSSGSNDAQMSSTWVFDASYLRVRNISFGYTLPKTLFNNKFVNSMRVYFSGQNLLTFDKLPQGIDPLIPNGTEGTLFPITSNFTFGVDVQF